MTSTGASAAFGTNPQIVVSHNGAFGSRVSASTAVEVVRRGRRAGGRSKERCVLTRGGQGQHDRLVIGVGVAVMIRPHFTLGVSESAGLASGGTTRFAERQTTVRF